MTPETAIQIIETQKVPLHLVQAVSVLLEYIEAMEEEIIGRSELHETNVIATITHRMTQHENR